MHLMPLTVMGCSRGEYWMRWSLPNVDKAPLMRSAQSLGRNLRPLSVIPSMMILFTVIRQLLGVWEVEFVSLSFRPFDVKTWDRGKWVKCRNTRFRARFVLQLALTNEEVLLHIITRWKLSVYWCVEQDVITGCHRWGDEQAAYAICVASRSVGV